MHAELQFVIICIFPFFFFFFLDKTVKLWKISERSYTPGNFNLRDDQGVPRNPQDVTSLRVPVFKPSDLVVEASPRRVYANAHTYHINSISLNSDDETYLSADDLRINLWHLGINDQSYSILFVFWQQIILIIFITLCSQQTGTISTKKFGDVFTVLHNLLETPWWWDEVTEVLVYKLWVGLEKPLGALEANFWCLATFHVKAWNLKKTEVAFWQLKPLITWWTHASNKPIVVIMLGNSLSV